MYDTSETRYGPAVLTPYRLYSLEVGFRHGYEGKNDYDDVRYYVAKYSEAAHLFTTTLPDGDVNGDGFVGGDDMSIIIGEWGKCGVTREQGDLDGDGCVGGADYTLVLTYWGTGIPPEPIPEPATLTFLLFPLFIILRQRRMTL